MTRPEVGLQQNRQDRAPVAALAAALAAALLLAMAAATAAHEGTHTRLTALDAALSAHPGNAQLHVRRAHTRAEHGDAAGALEDYDRAALLDPALDTPDGPLRLPRAQAWLELGCLTEARQQVLTHLVVTTDDGLAWCLLARIEAQRGQHIVAAHAWDRALELLPQATPDAALERLRALQLLPDGLARCRAALEQDLGRIGPAPALLQAALALDREAGDNAAALQRLERLNGGNARPNPWTLQHAQLLDQLGHHNQALALARKARAHLARRAPSRRSTPAAQQLAQQLDGLIATLTPAGSPP